MVEKKDNTNENLNEMLDKDLKDYNILLKEYEDLRKSEKSSKYDDKLKVYSFKILTLKRIKSFKERNITHINSVSKLIPVDYVNRNMEDYLLVPMNNENIKGFFQYYIEAFELYLEDRGNGQFRIIKDSIDYLINGNPPFFIHQEELFKKTEQEYLDFLIDAERVYLNRSLCLIPLKIGTQSHYIVCSNLSETLVLYEDKSFFTQINPQSNLYDIIQIHSGIIPNERSCI